MEMASLISLVAPEKEICISSGLTKNGLIVIFVKPCPLLWPMKTHHPNRFLS
jgi:hypothetical protein